MILWIYNILKTTNFMESLKTYDYVPD